MVEGVEVLLPQNASPVRGDEEPATPVQMAKRTERGRRDVRRLGATVIAAVAALGTIAEAVRRLFELFP